MMLAILILLSCNALGILAKKRRKMRKSHPNHHTSLDSSFLSPKRPAELYQVAAMAIYHGGLPMGLFEKPHMRESIGTLHPAFADEMAG